MNSNLRTSALIAAGIVSAASAVTADEAWKTRFPNRAVGHDDQWLHQHLGPLRPGQ